MFVTTTGELPGSNRFEISGTAGKILCENGVIRYYKNAIDSQTYSQTVSGTFAWPEVEVTEVPTDGNNPQHMGIINDFAHAILNRLPAPVDGKEGLNGVMLMNAMELSSWLGNVPVSIPFDEDLYLAELNKRVAISRDKSGVRDVVLDTTGSFESKLK